MPVQSIQDLTCACCGNEAKGRQWWNRDIGYGVCVRCGLESIALEGSEGTKGNYGIQGTHWDVKAGDAS